MTDRRDGERRAQLLQMGAGAVFLAIVAVAVLIVLSAGSSGGDADDLEGVGAVNRHLAGIPQQGLTLGEPDARVELIEYGDLQCPVCKGFAEEVLRPVIDHQVRAGKAKVTFRNFPFIGDQSAPAAAAALAAGAQGKGWQFLELFYRNQGIENSGYADDEFLTAIARAADVRNLGRWNRERESQSVLEEVEAEVSQAERLELTGTPSLLIRGPDTGGTQLLALPGGPEDLEEQIERAGRG